MKIAVAYDNGNIFQHFGRTESFKLYEIEDNTVISSKVIGSNGIGHGALAGLLAEQDVDVLICGGIGEGVRKWIAWAVNAVRCRICRAGVLSNIRDHGRQLLIKRSKTMGVRYGGGCVLHPRP